MNLQQIFDLTYSRINRIVSSEAKQWLWRAKLGLEKIVGESLLQLFFKLLVKELIRDVLLDWIKDFMT
jgi:hypothetical protein